MRRWTREEEWTLAEEYPRTKPRKVAEKLGRSLNSVYFKAQRMGIEHIRRWSEEDVTRELKALAEELGHSPRRHEVPKDLFAAAERKFGRWNEAKRAASLETDEEWERAKVLDELRELADRTPGSPTCAEAKEVLGKKKGVSLISACRYYFGSWNEAKEELGLRTFRPPPSET